MAKNWIERDKRKMRWIAFAVFLGLIGFAVVWHTVQETTSKLYWGIIESLVATVGIIIGAKRWGKKK